MPGRGPLGHRAGDRQADAVSVRSEAAGGVVETFPMRVEQHKWPDRCHAENNDNGPSQVYGRTHPTRSAWARRAGRRSGCLDHTVRPIWLA